MNTPTVLFDNPHVPNGWHVRTPKILVLGESSYDGGFYKAGVGDSREWVPAYLRGEQIDSTYTKVANAICGHAGRGQPAREAFWLSVAFMNFVKLPPGADNKVRPTYAQYESAKMPFAAQLDRLQPEGVWIWGLEQGKYSSVVCKSRQIPFVIVAHPVRGYSSTLTDSWRNLLALVSRR